MAHPVQNPTNARFVNLVFQGGGVRGLAYAGVLATKPDDVIVDGVGGSSAGAIVAALLAVGRTPDEIRLLLEHQDILALLDEDSIARERRYRTLFNEATSLLSPKTGKLRKFQLTKFLWRHRHELNELVKALRMKGLHGSEKIRSFLERDDVLGNRTFSEIVVSNLRIVAADVSNREYAVYGNGSHDGTPIIDAVLKSISIPLFFRPFRSGVEPHYHYFVDGGLLSNFPSFLFDDSEFPTIGFRLDDIPSVTSLESAGDFLVALLRTAVEAHDKHREPGPGFFSYNIPTAVRSTQFDLAEEDVRSLFRNGTDAGQRVQWYEHASFGPIKRSSDPKPREVLQLAMDSAMSLVKRYRREDLWVERLEDTVTFTLYIHADWSTTYSTVRTFNVGGDKSLFVGLHRGIMPSNDDFCKVSILDLEHVSEMEFGDSRQPLIKIPCVNTDDTKGFAVFYCPPISSTDDEPRRVRTVFDVQREFEATLGKGGQDMVGYGVRQCAHHHTLSLTMRILAHPELTHSQSLLSYDPDFERGVLHTDDQPESVSQGRGVSVAYDVTRYVVPPQQIVDIKRFLIRIARS